MMRLRNLLVLALVIAGPVLAMAVETIDSYGFDPVQVQNSLFGALRGGYYSPDIPADVRAMPAEEQKAVVAALGAFAKSYVASSGFKKEYGEVYKSSKPKSAFGLPSMSVGALTKTATDKAAGKDKKNEAWTLDKSPNVQIKKRLQAFLDVTADVDFKAATHGSNGMKYFDKAEYEQKPREWKMCYRAGKTMTDEIRSFAQSWITELK